ncbi:CheF family chemotaxis protein [Salinirubellus salinus]|uniref:CheF family chemotaxis protein n=1 Tax=Salinirubellus salinus TaxID=1364945 RepID=A0A9E7QZW4_9EURY|nr:CheF family chemotaxis protein [Salinirubellus salinus]UWM52987.1 CheF family chemotaxis protein [Salinirubellus salinus]
MSSPSGKGAKGGERPVVDFVASFVAGGAGPYVPLRGRVVMSSRRLVLVNAAARTNVPFGAIDDVAIGRVPENVADLFDDTVLVGYATGDGRRRTAIVGAETEHVDRFAGLLYRALLEGQDVVVRYATRVGGRLRDETPVRSCSASLDVGAGTLTFEDGAGWTETIEADEVGYVRWVDRTIGGETRTVLSVEHVEDGSALTTEVWMRSPRRLNVLGRFLRQEFSAAAAGASTVDVDEDDLEVLVAIHTLGEDATEMIRGDETMSERCEWLVDEGLVEDGPTGLQATAQGHVLLNRHFESVNE